MSLGVGADIESLCGKCGDVWHVVVAKVGERIAKVQCKQCGREHRHRPPDKAGLDRNAVSRPGSTGGGTGVSRGALASQENQARKSGRFSKVKEPAGPLVPVDPSRPLKTYRASEAYGVGDRVQHPQFGTGVVELIPGAGKMQVHFTQGRRILAQAKSASTLERPPLRPPEDGEGS